MTPDTDDLAPISVAVTPAFADYLGLNLRHVFRSPAILFFGLFPLALGTCYPLMPGIQVRPNNVVYLLPALGPPILFFAIVPLLTCLQARRRWRTVGEMREQRTYTFTDAGIQMTGATFNAFVAWSHVVAARRIGDQVALSTGQQVFYLIPVQAFEPAGTWERFRQLVETKVSGTRLA